ncbi:MAG: hypothetical protein ABSC94_17045 [Polyangiaceae bacterium]|jgi:hypothetical protein
MIDLDLLMRQALQNIDAVSDDPEARYRLCARFYAKYGHSWDGGFGYGNSELAFIRWEIKRGVLAPLGASPGSVWWRSVNEALLFDAELAALIHESDPSVDSPADVRRWLDYIKTPSAQTWYLAHNGSVVSAYLKNIDAARAELDGEQLFMNIVLYRLLYAGALSSRTGAFAPFDHLLADPALPAVNVLVGIREFYPTRYPLTRADVRVLRGRGDSLLDRAVRIFDDGIILPEDTALYARAAVQLGIPELDGLLRNGRPMYPLA